VSPAGFVRASERVCSIHYVRAALRPHTRCRREEEEDERGGASGCTRGVTWQPPANRNRGHGLLLGTGKPFRQCRKVTQRGGSLSLYGCCR
ncbi:Hypothetical predicted protein, partial [Pelobates cultripes]